MEVLFGLVFSPTGGWEKEPNFSFSIGCPEGLPHGTTTNEDEDGGGENRSRGGNRDCGDSDSSGPNHVIDLC